MKDQEDYVINTEMGEEVKQKYQKIHLTSARIVFHIASILKYD